MEKIYGVYAGGLDVSELDTLHEIDIWKLIDVYGGTIFWVNHDVADRRFELSDVDKEKLEEMQYILEYLVYYTRKFGVTFSREPKAGEHVERSEDYSAWYKFWKDHVDSWTDSQSDEFIARKANNEDYSHLLPETNWKGEPIVGSGFNA